MYLILMQGLVLTPQCLAVLYLNRGFQAGSLWDQKEDFAVVEAAYSFSLPSGCFRSSPGVS